MAAWVGASRCGDERGRREEPGAAWRSCRGGDSSLYRKRNTGRDGDDVDGEEGGGIEVLIKKEEEPIPVVLPEELVVLVSTSSYAAPVLNTL